MLFQTSVYTYVVGSANMKEIAALLGAKAESELTVVKVASLIGAVALDLSPWLWNWLQLWGTSGYPATPVAESVASGSVFLDGTWEYLIFGGLASRQLHRRPA